MIHSPWRQKQTKIKPSNFQWYSQVMSKRCISSKVGHKSFSCVKNFLLDRKDGHGTMQLRFSRKYQFRIKLQRNSECIERMSINYITQLRSHVNLLSVCWDTRWWVWTRPELHTHKIQRNYAYLKLGRRTLPSNVCMSLCQVSLQLWTHLEGWTVQPAGSRLHVPPCRTTAETARSGRDSINQKGPTKLPRASFLSSANDSTLLLRCLIVHFQTKRFHRF